MWFQFWIWLIDKRIAKVSGLISLRGKWSQCSQEWKGRVSKEAVMLRQRGCWEIILFYHILKLRCYTGISGPEKSRNNTREKISYFFTCVDIANQLLTRHSPLAPLGQVDEWTAKPLRFSIQVVCRSFLESWPLKHQKIRIADRQWG